METDNNADLNDDKKTVTKEPIKKEARSKGCSDLETLMHVIKANIGTGVLAMPLAFKNAGLVFASLSIWVLVIVCVYCMHTLLKCYKHVVEAFFKDSEVSDKIGYDDVVQLSFRKASKPDSVIPKIAKFIVSSFLIFNQLGCCCIYLVFVPTHLQQIIIYYRPQSDITIEKVMIGVVFLLMLFCMIQNLKILAPFSAFANFLMIVSMFVILYQLFAEGTFQKLNDLEMVAPYYEWPTYFSTAVYAFEGISLVLPVYHQMREKSHFSGWHGVLNTAMTIVAFMYFLIGFFGYLKYGDNALPSITLNLPVKNIIFQIVKLCFAIAIFISYNLQFIVVADIMWSLLYGSSKCLQSMNNKVTENVVEQNDNKDPNGDIPKSGRSIKLRIIEKLFRAFLVLLTFILAVTIPKIDLFINLVGAISSSTLSLVIPPVLDLVLFWPSSEYSVLKLVKNLLIFSFGIYIFVAGTYLSVQDIVTYFNGQGAISS